jgi:hypothetical protein
MEDLGDQNKIPQEVTSKVLNNVLKFDKEQMNDLIERINCLPSNLTVDEGSSIGIRKHPFIE